MEANQSGSTVLEALADPTRRAVFEIVAESPHSVARIAERLPVSRPAVSQHLKVLKDARLVRSTARGTSRIYSLDPRGIVAVQNYFQRFWSDAMASFAEAADRSATPEQSSDNEEQDT